MNTEPTQAARRAAEICLSVEGLETYEEELEAFSAIIERETGIGEALQLIRSMVGQLDDRSPGLDETHDQAWTFLEKHRQSGP